MKRIDVLPDDVLLGLFKFYVDMSPSHGGKIKSRIEAWQSLVHVCRRWRSLVFASPRHLNLQLYCTPKTPARKTLDVWPALPLIVSVGTTTSSGTNNVIATLGQHNRVCQVDLHPTRWDFWKMKAVLGAMQVLFPELTDLRLSSRWHWNIDNINTNPASRVPVIPDSFLGGSAPRLQNFTLEDLPLRGLPNLLSSANNLVRLRLVDIPYYEFISPEAMSACLSVLSNLRILCLKFETVAASNAFTWESQVPPPKRSILPVLDNFCFRGPFRYLEKLVTFINAPQLNEMHISFLSQPNFDCARLAQFINRTPIHRECDKARVKFGHLYTSVTFLAQGSTTLEIEILSIVPHWQFLSVAEVCNSFLHPLSESESAVKILYIKYNYSYREDRLENTRWLQILLPFTAVRNIYLSKEFAPGIMAALQEFRVVGGRTTEALPSLQNVFVEGFEPLGPFQDYIGQFVAARQLSGRPVAVFIRNQLVWDYEEEERESASSCMHPTLASIGRETDKVACAQR